MNVLDLLAANPLSAIILSVGLTSLFYTFGKDRFAGQRSVRRWLSCAEMSQYKRKWKAEFETTSHRDCDCYIANIKTYYKNYPDGGSPNDYFKAGFVGLYHDGVMFMLEWVGLPPVDTKAIGDVSHDEMTRIQNNNRKTGQAYVGYLPFHYIENVDWSGDEFAGKPVIFCFFNGKKSEWKKIGRTPFDEIKKHNIANWEVDGTTHLVCLEPDS